MGDNYLLDDDALILQKLHDDELYYIFLYLDLMDLLQVEEVSLRFAAVAWQVYRTYKKLDYCRLQAGDRTLTEYGAETIACRVGPNVENLIYVTLHNKTVIPDFIFTHFPKLQSILLYDCYESMDRKFIRKMGILIKRLKNVDLDSNDLSEEELTDWLKMSKLESLKVHIPFPEGVFLIKLSGIKELDLSGIITFDRERLSSNLRIFCTNNPDLQSLNLINCDWIDTKCLMSIAKLKNLEVLKISDHFAVDDMEDYLILGTLTKLKHFEIFGSTEDNRMIRIYILLIEGITKHSKLESLTLTHTSITRYMGRMKSEKKRIVENLTHLKELHLHLCAIWDDENLIELPCNEILERVRLEDCETEADTVVELIARCPRLKFLKLFRNEFDVDRDFIERILPLVKDRNHMLELETEENDKNDSDDYDDEDDEENGSSCKKLEDLRELFGIYKGVNSSKLQINYLEDKYNNDNTAGSNSFAD